MQKISIPKNVQKEPWYLKLNPNGKIPVIIDRARDNFTVFETAAILLYLEQHYDAERRFSFDPVEQPNDYSEMLQWIFWAVRLSGGCCGFPKTHYRFNKPARRPGPDAGTRYEL